jgi:hypothetical protein
MDTQPKSYANKLISAGVISEQEVQQVRDQINQHFEAEYQASLTF